MRVLRNILINGLMVYFIAWLFSGIYVTSVLTAIFTGLVLGILNWTIKPVLVILTLPITILTLGLFYLIVNGLIVLLTDALISGFEVHGLGWAILFSICMTILNLIIGYDQIEVEQRQY
ncbi:MAG TPA: phage holin family protein [Saprospiraceae bacterium]|nr:phage holin family protein [Saprospiraceae bacterium]